MCIFGFMLVVRTYKQEFYERSDVLHKYFFNYISDTSRKYQQRDLILV